MEKQRLDRLLVEKGLAESRERAKYAIASGIVYVDGRRAEKPGATYFENATVEIRGETLRYVSRGGLKLEKALEVFSLDLSGVIAIDVGASTGGFTDCMLQNGAEHVYSVDVGRDQLAAKLRSDPRVTVMEDTDIRKVLPEQFEKRPGFATIDVSFISLSLILPQVSSILTGDGCAVALVKPQFEAGRERVGKNGIVRKPEIHVDVLRAFTQNAESAGFAVAGLDYSPVTGGDGNIEYIAMLTKSGGSRTVDIIETVRLAHASLGREH